MNAITETIFKEFIEQHELDQNIGQVDTLAENFEHFCNYLVVTSELRQDVKLDAVHTKRGGDGGFDGIAIVVNGNVVTSTDEIDDIQELTKNSKTLELDIILIQSKSGSRFNGGDIKKLFFDAGKLVANEDPTSNYNQTLKLKRELWLHATSYASQMSRSPNCYLYYVTTGVWSENHNLQTDINHGKQLLYQTGLFEEIDFQALGAPELQSLYREIRIGNEISIDFKDGDSVQLPEISGIDDGYYGLIPFPEFRKLVVDERNRMLPVFEDNVRGFQDYENKVNIAIRDTVRGDEYSLFCVLNNGVTIVARSIKRVQRSLSLTDYQIVNGCQTSHVLAQHTLNLGNRDDLYVPIRIVATEDEEIRKKITLATNSQIEIKQEQLAALSDFHISLETYYSSKGVVDEKEGLHYERRSNQYYKQTVTKTKIVSLQMQIKSFVSMFLDRPHIVSGYFGTIMGNLKGEIFAGDHRHSPYYLSGLAMYRLEAFFRSGHIDTKYKKIKYHALMVARLIASKSNCPPLNSKVIDHYCESLESILLDTKLSVGLFKQSIEIIESCGFDIENTKQFKAEAETRKILDAVKLWLAGKNGYEPEVLFAEKSETTKDAFQADLFSGNQGSSDTVNKGDT